MFVPVFPFEHPSASSWRVERFFDPAMKQKRRIVEQAEPMLPKNEAALKKPLL